MAARTVARVARLQHSREAWLTCVRSSPSQPSWFPCGIGKVDGDVSGRSSFDDNLAAYSSRSRLAACLRRARNGSLCGAASNCGGDTFLWGNPAGGLVVTRSFAAKAKKLKSRSEDTVEVDEDAAVVAKDSATKMMELALDVLSREHSKLRTGRVSSGMLDHITVDAHGVRTPLSHIAAVSVAGLQTLSVLPYDPSMVKEVEKALLMSPLGLNPVSEGSTLTVPLPRLTKEVCESMCKLAVKAGETAKLSIRRARKDALDRVKAAGLSKDELKRFEKEVEEMTRKYVKTTDELCKKKEKEILA